MSFPQYRTSSGCIYTDAMTWPFLIFSVKRKSLSPGTQISILKERICIIMLALSQHILIYLSAAVARGSSSITQQPSQIKGANLPLASVSSDKQVPAVQDTLSAAPLAHLPLNFSYSSLSATRAALCDGKKYGHEVKSSSCIDALETIPDLERSVSFGPRHQGHSILGSCILSCTDLCRD